MKGAYFGNGVYVSDDGVIHLGYRLPPGGLRLHAAKAFKDSLEEAIGYAERLTSPLRGEVLMQRKHAPN